MNYGFIIDNRKCIGCHACTVACKAEHDVPIGVNRTWVKYIEKGEYPHSRRIFSVMRCNHCEDAPCVEICPVTALHVREDGIVDFDGRRCIGCKACTQACPYDALYIDPNEHTAAKCNYCAHRIDVGLEPACVNVCPEHAIISGDIDDPESEIGILLAREQVTARKTEKGTRPKLFYIDGDASALTPTASPQSSDYMWSSQSTGVGHFANYAESLIARQDPLEMARKLAGNQTGNKIEDSEGRHMPSESSAAAGDASLRRVYDAPAKGIVWGWEVMAYVWTKAISAGAILVLALLSITNGFSPTLEIEIAAAVIAIVFLTLTGILLVKDLDRPDRFLYVLLRPQWKSWLVRGGYAITFYGLLLVVWGAATYTLSPVLKQLSWWGAIIFALITAIYTAFLFAQAKGRDFWQSPVLTLHMLLHAVTAGAAAFALLIPFGITTTGWAEALAYVLVVSLMLNLAIIIIELWTPHATADARTAVKSIISGSLSRPFWLGTVVAGSLLPLLLLQFAALDLLWISALLSLAGLLITEHIWIKAPQLLPLS